jgi:hypothetical protein
MWDPSITQAAAEKTAHVPREVIANLPDDRRGLADEEAYDAAWSAWLGMTAFLMSLGFTANTICDGANTVVTARNEFAHEHDAERATA